MNMMILAAVLSEATVLRMGPMTGPVTIDNEITFAEQAACSVQYGGISDRNGLMANRYVVYHVGYDEKGFYFGVRSSVPEHPLVLTDSDTVSLTLLPPGAEKPFVFTKRVKEGRMLDGITQYGKLVAETEMFVPYADLGGRRPAAGERWGLQMTVDFTNPKERATWAYDRAAKDDPAALGTLVIDPEAPLVSIINFYTLEMWRASANVRMFFRLNNTGGKAFRTDHRTILHAGIGNSKLDGNPELDAQIQHKEFDQLRGAKVAGGEVKEIVPLLYNLWPGSVNIFDIDIGEKDRTFLRRKISWDLSKGLDWTDEEGLPNVRLAFFPSLDNRLRMNYRVGKKTDLVKGRLEIVGAKTGRIWAKDLTGAKYLRNGIVDETFGKLANDVYTLHFTAQGEDGRAYADYDVFEVATFPWQTAEVGKDRIIVAPFVPIKVEKVKGEGEGEQWNDKVSFLQTGYRCGGVLWDEVYAKDENILTAPVTLKLNGQEFKVQSSKFIEQSPDRVIREVTAVPTSSLIPHPSSLVLTLRQDYDYDGFCKVSLAFDAKEPVEVKSLQLEIPIKDEIVRYFNVLTRNDMRAGPAPDFTFPSGEGEVWNSATDRKYNASIYPAPIQNYIWLGGVEKGFAWLVQSFENWSLRKGFPAERAIRENGTVRLVCDFVNEPVTWTGRKTFDMYFEPTPVKPRDLKHLKFADYMYSYVWPTNSIRYAMTFGAGTMMFPMLTESNRYPNDDKSLLNWKLAQKTLDTKAFWDRHAQYVERNRDWFSRQYVTSVADFTSDLNKPRNCACEYPLVYWNPRLSTVFWPEWKMYRAEWYVEPFTPMNYYNEYMSDVTPSRVDKLMWDARQSLDDGAAGLYYDCYGNMGGWCIADGTAWIDPTRDADDWGAARQKLGNQLGWRDIMKRSAVVCQLYGRLYNGRPITELHDTEGNVAMVNAFSMTGLSTERSSNGGDFQDRFCESYTLVNIIGGQTGKGSRIIVSTIKGDETRKERELKSLMGYLCAYGFFTMNDQGIIRREWFWKAWNIPFDYGIGEDFIEHHFYYDGKPQPFAHDGKDVRMNVLERKDGTGMLILVGNLGEATTFAFRPNGTGKAFSFTDAETGASVDPAAVAIERHGYRMIYAKGK